MPPGRPHGLDQDDTREQLAQLLARGMSGADIGEVMGRHKDTINVWRHDKVVQERVSALRRERVNRFVSKIDAELEKRLEHPGKLTVTELIKIRQSLLPKAGGQGGGENPEAARERWRQEDERTAAGAPEVPIPSG